MSLEAIAHVFADSPATGTTRLVHLAVADIANKKHGFQFWASTRSLEAMTLAHRRTVQRALDELVELGHLTVLEERSGQATRYRFEFVYEQSEGWREATPRGGERPPLNLDLRGGERPPPGWREATPRGGERPPPKKEQKLEQKKTQAAGSGQTTQITLDVPAAEPVDTPPIDDGYRHDMFDRWLANYPVTDPSDAKARKRFRALIDGKHATPAQLNTAARHFAEAMAREGRAPKFITRALGFLSDDYWVGYVDGEPYDGRSEALEAARRRQLDAEQSKWDRFGA